MKRYAVVGLGQFGLAVAQGLAAHAEVLVIDKLSDRIDSIKDKVSRAVVLNSTDERSMRQVNADDVEVAVVAFGENDFEATILTTALFVKFHTPTIIVRAGSDFHGEILEKIGATKIVYPERAYGQRIAEEELTPNVTEYIRLARNRALVEIKPSMAFLNKTLRECDFRAKFGINVIAINRHIRSVDERGNPQTRVDVNDVPNPESKLTIDDTLVVVGPEEGIRALTEGGAL